jgi:O-antigen ligase
MLLFAVLMILLPSIRTDELIHGTVSGKMFFFLYAMLFCGVLLILKTIFKSHIYIRFSILDGLLLIWAVYIISNGFFKQMPVSGRLLEFSGLTVFYIVLRNVEPSKYGILLIATVVGGAIQAIYGNLQLWGYYPSLHNQFRITGSFFNPGPFAGYLASVFSVALGIYMFKINPFPKINNVINRMGMRIFDKFQLAQWPVTSCIAGVTLMIMLLILLPSQSRAAWLAVIISSVVLFTIRYPVIQWTKKYSLFKRTAMLLLLCAIIGVCAYGLFRFKAESANGRVLIWKVTGTMIAEHPVFGTGFDRFKSFYMAKQANYFEQVSDSPEAMVADDTNYAFNEFLQHTAENGLIGLVLMIAILAAAFRVIAKPFNDLAWIAKAGIVGISVFAFFSYPAQILPIKMGLTLYLACLSSLAEQRTWQVQAVKYIPVKCALAVCLALVSIAGINCLNVARTAWENWNSAYRVYATGNYTDCLPYYEKAWPVLKTDGDYLTNYGKALSMAGEHGQAVKVLQQAALYYPNIVVYTALGDSYKALEKPVEAEQSYLEAWYMNPSRFFPKYLLAKLYDETGQTEKALATANELLNKEVKVESSAINEIKEEMGKILNKYKN